MTDVVFNSLLDEASLNYLRDKKLVQGFSHYDVWLTEHQTAFTVAKMMDDDMLAEVKSALESAIANGTDFRTFKKQLVPYLMSRGWWGEQVMGDPMTGEIKKVQLGSFRRLKTIFDTNLSTAYAAGQWARISQDADEFPYLKYIPSVSAHKRDTHKKYYNQIWKADDPIWQSIFPPNGYGCQCSVRQLSEKQALRERNEDIKKQPEHFTDEQKANAQNGKIDDKNVVKWVDFTNPRTGEIVRVPDNVTPSFAHNHGDRLGSLLSVYADKHGNQATSSLKQQLDAYILGKLGDDVRVVDFSGVEVDKNEVKRLLHDLDTGKEKPWEAIPAAQWQQYFGVKLERYNLVAKNPPDFLIIEEGVARDKLQTLDFMYTMTGYPQEKIDALNQFFARPNTDDWDGKIANIQRHLKKANIIPMDLRYLTAINRVKLLSYVLSLPREQQKQIIFIVGEI